MLPKRHHIGFLECFGKRAWPDNFDKHAADRFGRRIEHRRVTGDFARIRIILGPDFGEFEIPTKLYYVRHIWTPLTSKQKPPRRVVSGAFTRADNQEDSGRKGYPVRFDFSDSRNSRNFRLASRIRLIASRRSDSARRISDNLIISAFTRLL